MIDAIFDVLPDGLCVTDERGVLLYMNPAAERLLGRSMEDIREKTLCEVLCGRLSADGKNNCAEDCPLRGPDAPAGAVSFSGPYHPDTSYVWRGTTVQRKDGLKRLRVRCLKTSYAFPSPGERRNVTLIEDASAEEELERHREDWRSMIAHDLRAPLTNILATLRLIQDDAKEGRQNPPPPELIDISVRSCGKIMELLDLYLDVAKLDAGLMPVKPAVLDLGAVAAACAAEQKALADSKSIGVRLDIPAGTIVLADQALLERVIQNLLNNALKFTPSLGAVVLAARGDGRNVVLSVSDTGPGIAAEDVPLIFDRFHQAKARRAGRLQGTGLGLAFCRQAMKAMKGDIRLAATSEAGSDFQVTLPGA